MKQDLSTCVFILPPPNVTGDLHIGHALNISIQDIKARFLQLFGYKVQWIPGTDHSGIATQLVAQRQLKAEGKDAALLSRDELMKYIWTVKEKYEANIKAQIIQMNTIISWEHYAFTMDEVRSKEVTKAFVDLYKEGKIFKSNRFVYWDTQLQTSYSDLEVEFKTVKGNFYYIKYALLNSDEYVVIATTRPETLFGDVALCVHPDDVRYKHLIGKTVIVPFVNRQIPIIADEMIEMEKGTGILKVTPAHDLLDYELGVKHNLESISVINKQGRIYNSIEQFDGLEVLECKKAVAAALDTLNLLEKVEHIDHNVPHGEKSGTQLELIQTEQWFINTDEMAQQALEVVENKQIEFFPEFFINTYRHWMKNIQPWCISRQIIWGHRLPVWYVQHDKQQWVVAENEDQAYTQAKEQFGNDVVLEQETDVLDTWFSSALWPFATQVDKEEIILPNSFLVTGRDILFFWVARMIMMTLQLKKTIPFKQVCLHGLVLDKHGHKMSKMTGNTLNPLELITKFNADTLRTALIYNATAGQDVKFQENDLVLVRNFITKIENAMKFCRFVEATDVDTQFDITQIWCSWIIQECMTVKTQVKNAIDQWEIGLAFEYIEKFARDKYCSWFIEASKHLNDDCVKKTLSLVGANILMMLKPFMPEFVQTEYHLTFNTNTPIRYDSLNYETALIDHKDVYVYQAVIEKARSVLKWPIKQKLIYIGAQLDAAFIARMLKSEFIIGTEDAGIKYTFEQGQFIIETDDIPSLTKLIEKEMLEHEKVLSQANARLKDAQFLEKASAEMQAEMQNRVRLNEKLLAEKQRLCAQLQ